MEPTRPVWCNRQPFTLPLLSPRRMWIRLCLSWSRLDLGVILMLSFVPGLISRSHPYYRVINWSAPKHYFGMSERPMHFRCYHPNHCGIYCVLCASPDAPIHVYRHVRWITILHNMLSGPFARPGRGHGYFTYTIRYLLAAYGSLDAKLHFLCYHKQCPPDCTVNHTILNNLH